MVRRQVRAHFVRRGQWTDVGVANRQAADFRRGAALISAGDVPSVGDIVEPPSGISSQYVAASTSMERRSRTAFGIRCDSGDGQ